MLFPFAEAVELLLQEGATPDLQSGRDGCTSMHAAAHNGHVKVITALAAGGADVDVQSNNGTTPLHNAATNGSVEAVEALLAAGADADIENQLGNTPMHMAAGKGWAEVVEKLVEGGADFTLRNQKGHSAVQSAANCGSFDTVLRLVRLGAAWRLKGDIDVVKTLTRKTTLKTSYIEGRLRLAEKERHRKGAAKPGQGVGSGAEGGGTSDGGTTDGERSKEQIEAAKAQADAVMEALLQEEMAEKVRKCFCTEC